MAKKHYFNLAYLLLSMPLLLGGMTAPAQAADPLLQRLNPQGGQRGTEVTVTITGQRLADGPYQVLLYDTGIEIKSVGLSKDKKNVTCVLQLPEDCRLGRHALRLRTNSGLSNLVTFHVGNLTEINEVEPNNTAEQPQEIATNVVVNGVIQTGDIDVFAVDLTAGERLSVEIEGIRLGRVMFDPLIEIRDAAGKLLVQNDDQPVAYQDAFVTFQATAAGPVFIHVRESAYRGDSNSNYRLHIGHFPRPKAVTPPAILAGQPAKLNWIDEAFKKTPVTIEVPPTAGKIHYPHATDEQGISPSGLPVYLTSSAPYLEAEPNNNTEQANSITAPGFATGTISTAGDKDFFRFTMKKGQEWDFRVRARELRSPLDAVLHIFDTKGKYLKGNDDDSGQPDSYLRFKAPADAEYTLDVEDRQLRGRPNMTYLLEITKPKPIAVLKLVERRRYISQIINIPQGGRTAAMMTVKRNDFGGELQVNWENLPAGCQAKSFPIASNYNRIPILFTAQPEATLSASLATVSIPFAKQTKKKRELESLFTQQTWLVRGRNNIQFWSHFADRPAVAVTQALPYSIRVVEPKAPLVRGGSIDLKIIAKRNEGFKNALSIRTLYNPPGVSTNQSRSIPKDKLEALIPITANGNARLGEWKLAFLGKTTINGQVEASTQLVTLRIAEPYFDPKIASLSVIQGQSAEWTIPLEQRTPFEGDAEVELLRLPIGVTAKKIKIQANAKSVVIPLTLTKEARVGRHRGVTCQVRLTVEGEPVRYTQGYVDLHIDPPPATKTADGSTSNTEGQSS